MARLPEKMSSKITELCKNNLIKGAFGDNGRVIRKLTNWDASVLMNSRQIMAEADSRNVSIKIKKISTWRKTFPLQKPQLFCLLKLREKMKGWTILQNFEFNIFLQRLKSWLKEIQAMLSEACATKFCGEDRIIDSFGRTITHHNLVSSPLR